ncbi:MAG TPA: hypothetical protein VFR02_01375, partial [bacterium]|nr:hypothetical protein [bacterium]
MKNKKPSPKPTPLLPRVLLGAALLALAGFLYFVYGYLPAQVGKALTERAKVRQPLTTTPKADGLAYQDAAFTAADGVPLKGWWLPSAAPGKARGTVILTHGVFKNREQVLARAEFLARAGYQVLLFDLRGCG